MYVTCTPIMPYKRSFFIKKTYSRFGKKNYPMLKKGIIIYF